MDSGWSVTYMYIYMYIHYLLEKTTMDCFDLFVHLFNLIWFDLIWSNLIYLIRIYIYICMSMCVWHVCELCWSKCSYLCVSVQMKGEVIICFVPSSSNAEKSPVTWLTTGEFNNTWSCSLYGPQMGNNIYIWKLWLQSFGILLVQNVKTILFLMLPNDGSYKPSAKASHTRGHLHETHGSRKVNWYHSSRSEIHKKKHQTYQTNQTWIAGTTPPTDRLCETGVGMEDHLPLRITNFLRVTLMVGLVIFHQITSSCSYGK
jgi:hypothetical protein